MKNIKTKITIVLTMSLLLLSACAKDDVQSGEEDVPLEDIVEKLYQGLDIPPYETIPLTEENFEYFAFVPYSEDLSAVAADALVNITAHSLVVIRTEQGNGAELAKAVAANADPNKWLCVRADAVSVAYTDHYVVLIMSYQDLTDGITENFRAMATDLDGMEMQTAERK